MHAFSPNEIGLTKFSGYSDASAGQRLEEQLANAGIPVETAEIPHLIGMAGNARLVFYRSPKTNLDVTVLLVPIRSDIDSFGEDYYYFEGMGRAAAMEDEQKWLERYDAAKELVRQAIYGH